MKPLFLLFLLCMIPVAAYGQVNSQRVVFTSSNPPTACVSGKVYTNPALSPAKTWVGTSAGTCTEIDASVAAPANATYIVQTPNATLTNEQALSLLATGIPLITTTTGVISISSVTNDVQTKAAIVPNTAPSSGQLLAGNAGGTAYAPVSMSGDATLASTGAITLASVVSAGGPTGSATVAPIITYDAKGRLTTVSSATITPAIGSITGLGTGVATALAVNVGTAGAFVVNGGALGSPSSAGTIPAFTLGGTISGGGNQLNNIIIGTSTPLAGTFTAIVGTSSAINGTETITSASATALTVGRLGATTPALQIDASTATSITGIKIKSAASGGGVAISAIGEASNGNLTLDAQGSGTITIGGTSTGAITLTRATTMSNALTYGGVTLSNAVTGTGNMVLSAGPTFTGTVTIPTPFTIGAVSMTSTGTQLNYLNAATGTTGTTSTNVVFSTSPTLVTPTLGVATSTRLGIGTAAAAASGLNLSVSASNVQAALIYNTNATDGYGLDVSTAANDATRYSLIVRGNANRADFQILSNATINLNTTSYNTCTALTTTAGVLGCTVSDPRVKNSIRPFQENALDIISKIHPITFQFNKGTPWYKGRTELGFNARNLMNADSLLASETGNASGSFLQPEQLAIQALEMAGINELRERVDRLEKEKLNEKTTRNRRPVRRYRSR